MIKSLPLLEGGSRLSMSQFDKEMIMPGLNSCMRVKHADKDGKTFTTKAQTKELLHKLEDVDEEHKRSHHPKPNKEHKSSQGKKMMMIPSRAERNPAQTNADCQDTIISSRIF